MRRTTSLAPEISTPARSSMPPGLAKAFCISTTTTAVRARSISKGSGRVSRLSVGMPGLLLLLRGRVRKSLIHQPASQPANLRGLANGQSLAVCADIARPFPGGEDAARCIESHAAHLGHILPGEWKLNHGIASLGHHMPRAQAQQCMCDTLLGPFRGHFPQPLLDLTQPSTDDPDQIERDGRIPMNQLEKRCLWPADLERVHHR